MRNLTIWAKSHPRAAQAAIAAGHILTAILTVNLGVLLLTLGVEVPAGLVFFTTLTAIPLIWLYPARRDCPTSGAYHSRRRWFDAALLLLGAVVTTFLANRLTADALTTSDVFFEKTKINTAPGTAAVAFVNLPAAGSEAASELPQVLSEKKTKGNFFKKMLQKRLVKKFQRWSSAAPELPDGEKIAYVVLILLGVLGIEFLLTYLVCYIACSGAEALAVIVALGGLVGIAAGVAALFRKIFPRMSRGQRIGWAVLMTLLPVVVFFGYILTAGS